MKDNSYSIQAMAPYLASAIGYAGMKTPMQKKKKHTPANKR